MLSAVFALIGVGFGWGLQEFATWRRSREERRRTLRRGVAALLYWYKEMTFFHTVLEYVAARGMPPDRSEELRSLIIENRQESFEVISEDLGEIIRAIATEEPITAYRLRALCDEYGKILGGGPAYAGDWDSAYKYIGDIEREQLGRICSAVKSYAIELASGAGTGRAMIDQALEDILTTESMEAQAQRFSQQVGPSPR